MLFVPAVGSIDVELQVEALAQYTTQALNATHQAITLLMDETTQMQNHMALDLLTAVQGATCAYIHISPLALAEIGSRWFYPLALFIPG